MGFGKPVKDGVSITPGGIDPESVTNSQRGIPIPYLAGTQAVAARQICEEWGLEPIELPAAKSSGKGSDKGASSAGSGRYNIYGSLAGLLCHGPIDNLNFVEVDQIRRWSGNLALGSVNPAPVSIPGIGPYNIFIGDTDQPDWGLPTVSWSAVPHPRYNGFAGFRADHILFGEGRTAPPSHRFGLSRRPRQTLITGPAAALDDGQANPFCVLLELLTSPWCGLGAPTALFNQASWQVAADKAYANKDLTYISILLNSRIQAKALAADLFVLCDGYWRLDRATGGCEVGIYPQPETIIPSTLPLVTYRGFIDPPDLDVIDDVVTRFLCTFPNREKNYQTDSSPYNDPAARGGIGLDNREEISRPYITRRAQIKSHLKEYSRRRSLSTLAGKITDRQYRAQNLRPGDNLRLDIDLEPGGTQVEKIARILSVTHPYRSQPTYQVEGERTLTPITTTPAEPPPSQEEEEVADIAQAEIFELPPQLSDGGEFAVSILAERPAALVTECAVYYDPATDTSATFPSLGYFRSFALRAELSTSATNSATSLALTLLSARSREIIADDPGPVAARNNELLLILLHAYSSGQKPIEICSVQDITSTGTDAVSLTVLRGRCGTAPLAHASAVSCWLIRREALSWFRHNDFPARANAAQTCYLILQPSTNSVARPLADCTTRSFLFDTVRSYAPLITVDAPASTTVGVEVDHALAFSGAVTDQDENLVSITLLRVNGGIEEILFDRQFAPCKRMTWSIAAVAFTIEGSAALIVRAQDSTRRTVEKRINVVVGAAGGGGTMPTDKIRPPEIVGDARLFVTPGPPASTPYPYTASKEEFGGDVAPVGGQTLVWADITSSSLTGLAINSIADGPGSIVAGTVPAIQFLVATSSIGALTPETAFCNVNPYAINTDNSDEGYIQNVHGGSPGNFASTWSDSFLRGTLFPRVEAGVRIWIKAHDIHGVLFDSETVFFDIYF